MSELHQFFENYLHKESIFLDKSILSSSHTPTEILYREEQLREVAHILAPALRGERPSNLFIYGKTGTGKTISIQHVLQSMESIAQKNGISFRSIYINCKLKRVADTEYRLIAQLIKEYGHSVPATGLPTDEIYNIFYGLLDEQKQVVLLVLDEVDQLTKKIGDDILYNLTRINSGLKQSQIVLIGISNSLVFAEHLDPRVKSSLSEEEIIYPPYNALQIQEILRKRAELAFTPDALKPGVIEKCAAYAARDHGDARRAIDLLRIAGEIAARSNSAQVEVSHLDDAERRAEGDKVISAALGQPKQFQAVLYAVFLFFPQQQQVFTGEIYEIYQKICRQIHCNVLTQRRVSDILAELDMLGIIRAKIISKGRYGRTREITFSVEESIVIKLKELLEKSLQVEHGERAKIH